MSFAAAERHRLAHLLRSTGPAAPTLCEGWTTADLVTHLYLREHRPDATLGMFLPPLATHTERVMRQYQERWSYEEIVDKWEAGFARWNPLRATESLANTTEHFIHYEDVARAAGEWGERDFSAVVNASLFRIVRTLAPLLLRRSTAPVHLVAPGKRPVTVASRRGVAVHGGAGTWVFGNPGELLLWSYGRKAVNVRLEGDRDTVVWSTF